MDIQILPVTRADIEPVGRLARSVWQDTYLGIITQAQIDYMLEERYNPMHLTVELAASTIWWDKAVLDGELVAFASTLLTADPSEMKLDKLYVDLARQRLGLGARLIDHVFERALVLGRKTLILAVNKSNERAISAYLKHGFVVREAVRLNIGNDFVMDDFIMAKSLC